MTITNSTMSILDLLDSYDGPKVLLVEADCYLLRHHTYMLRIHRFSITQADRVSSGLARILNGETFDCILVDADKSERLMVDFLHQCLRLLPEVNVIVMGSNDIRRWICRDPEEYKVVHFLPKPCGIKEISDLLKYIFRDRIQSEAGTSNGNLVNPSAILNTPMIKNNLPFRDGAHHQGININFREHNVMSKPVAYVDLSSDDEQSSLKKNIGLKIQDKGKTPMEQKRKKFQPYEYDNYLKKREEIKARTAWTSAHHDKFKETLIGFDKKKAYQNTSLEQTNMPAGLTFNHTGSYLQDHKAREISMNKYSMVTGMQEGNNFQIESYACKRFGLSSTPSDNNASILEAGYLQKQPSTLNFDGASFMNIEFIKAKLGEAPSYSLSQQTTASVSNANGYVPPQPLIVESSTNSGFGFIEHPHKSTGQHIELIPQFSLSRQTITAVDNANGYIPPQPLIGESSTNSGFGFIEHPHNGTGQNIELTQTIQAGYVPPQPLIVESSTNSGFGFIEHPHKGTGKQIELTQTIQAGGKGKGKEPLVTDGNFSYPGVEVEMTHSVVDVLGKSQLNLGITNAYNYSNGFDDPGYFGVGDINEALAPIDRYGVLVETSITGVGGNLGVGDISESLAPIDRYGVLVETSATGVGGNFEASSSKGNFEASSSKHGLEDLMSFLDSENLFEDDGSCSENFTLGYEVPRIPSEESPMNSIYPYDGSEGRVMDENWYLELIHHDHNMSIYRGY